MLPKDKITIQKKQISIALLMDYEFVVGNTTPLRRSLNIIDCSAQGFLVKIHLYPKKQPDAFLHYQYLKANNPKSSSNCHKIKLMPFNQFKKLAIFEYQVHILYSSLSSGVNKFSCPFGIGNQNLLPKSVIKYIMTTDSLT